MSDVVLYAEDDENDAFLLADAFKRVGIPDRLVVVDDGRAAIEYLAGEGLFADRTQHPLPRLVLLDLKMPAVTGLEVLQWIKGPPVRATVPTVVLSSSGLTQDRIAAGALGASGYHVKSARLDEMVALVHELRRMWLA